MSTENMSTLDCFYKIGAGIARMHQARPEYQHPTAPAVAVAEAYAAGEVCRLEYLQALTAWEGSSLKGRTQV